MEVFLPLNMGAPGASHLGTGDHGPKTDRSRPRSVPVNADVDWRVYRMMPNRRARAFVILGCHDESPPCDSPVPGQFKHWSLAESGRLRQYGRGGWWTPNPRETKTMTTAIRFGTSGWRAVVAEEFTFGQYPAGGGGDCPLM